MFIALQTNGETLSTIADVHAYAQEALGNDKKADRFMERCIFSPREWHRIALHAMYLFSAAYLCAAGHKRKYWPRTGCKASLSAIQAAKSQHPVRAPAQARATM